MKFFARERRVRCTGRSAIQTRLPVLHASVSMDALSPVTTKASGQRKIREVGVRPAARRPVMDVCRDGERVGERARRVGRGSAAGAYQKRAALGARERVHLSGEAPGSRNIEDKGDCAAADQHRKPRARQGREAPLPFCRGAGPGVVVHAVERQREVQHVSMLGHPVLRRCQHEIKPVQVDARAPEPHELGRIARLAADPVRDAYAALAAADHKVGPGRRERARRRLIERKLLAADQRDKPRARCAKAQLLYLERPPERARERQQLRVVPGFLAGENPDVRLTLQRPGRPRACGRASAASDAGD